MHKYWARKPHNVVAEYIKYYSKPREIVLDPFAGSGVTAVEALKLKRKAIAIDRNPVSTFITEMTAIPADCETIRQAVEAIARDCRTKIEALYETECPKCKKATPATCTIWSASVDCPKCGKNTLLFHAKKISKSIVQLSCCGSKVDTRETDTKEAVPVEVRIKECSVCKGRSNKPFGSDDQTKLTQIESTEMKYWYPKVELRYPDGQRFKEGTHREGLEQLADVFTHRNLNALSILHHSIETVKTDDKTKDLLKFAFTSMVHLSSRMTPDRPTRPYSSFWAQHRYAIMPVNMESNVWFLFESAVYGLVKGKEQANAELSHFKKAKNFKGLKTGNFWASNQSAVDLSNIPKAKIDYVFTDPPYGGDIQYFELSWLWLSWLRGENNDPRFDPDWFKDEVTINPQQGKDFDNYHSLLHAAFSQVWRVLKPGRYLTVTFHNTDVAVYNSIIRAVLFSNFDLERMIYQPPARASAKSLLQPLGSAVGDYYLRFRKSSRQTAYQSDRDVDEESAKRIILKAVEGILAERGQPSTYTDILKGHNRIYQELAKHGYRFFGADPDNIKDVLNHHKGKEFTFIEGEGWFFLRPWEHHLDTPLNDRVEDAVLQVLRRRRQGVSFDDLLQEIYVDYLNALTPDPPKIRTVLEEYAEPVGDKWRMTSETEALEGQHSVMIGLLAQLGKKCGYHVWVGKREQGEVYGGKPLGSLADLKSLRSVKVTNRRAVQQIDVLWIRKEDLTVAFAFEVEFTTSITEALRRGSDIPNEHKPHRVIVIPDKRLPLLERKAKSKLIKEEIETQGWRIIKFEGLTNFYNKHRSESAVLVEDFRKTLKALTDMTPAIQGKMETYLAKE